MNQPKNNESGFALIAVLYMITILSTMLAAYMVITKTELGLVKASRDSASGFNVAEAGLNVRAEDIKLLFENYDKPTGTSPGSISDCDTGSPGSGDYECRTHNFGNNHTAVSYITEAAGNPIFTTIPPGEAFAGLSAQEYRYTVTSVGRNNQQSNEAILELTFKSRLVPLFQFAVFFEDDLEFFNGGTMTMSGPVHTNGNMYLAAQTGGQNNFSDAMSVAGTFYRGMKSQSSCSGYTGTSRVTDGTSLLALPSCSGSRSIITDVTAWNENIDIDLDPVSTPAMEDLEPFSDSDYWTLADLRLVLQLAANGTADTSNSATGIEVVDVDGNNIAAATNALHGCTGGSHFIETNNNNVMRAVGSTWWNNSGPDSNANSNLSYRPSRLRLARENQWDTSLNEYQTTMEVDMTRLFNCIHANPGTILNDSKALDDDSEDGLVFYMTINGPRSADAHNNYTIRLQNADYLGSSTGGAAEIEGLTVVTNQGVAVWGDYNDDANWKPAAILADAIYILSNAWNDFTYSPTPFADEWARDANDTNIYAAVVTGIKRTGGALGIPGHDQGANSNGGGAINFMRFSEDWRNNTYGVEDFVYVGSIVSLGEPLHSASTWGPFTYYDAPDRVWSYDTRFNNPDNLPPMTPAFVYLRQELFVRNFEL